MRNFEFAPILPAGNKLSKMQSVNIQGVMLSAGHTSKLNIRIKSNTNPRSFSLATASRSSPPSIYETKSGGEPLSGGVRKDVSSYTTLSPDKKKKKKTAQSRKVIFHLCGSVCVNLFTPIDRFFAVQLSAFSTWFGGFGTTLWPEFPSNSNPWTDATAELQPCTADD